MQDLLQKTIEEENKITYTKNGALAYNTTSNALLDLFSSISSLRRRPDYEIKDLFEKAYATDKVLALKMMFYIRNIRGTGQGERRVFRVMLQDLATIDKETCLKVLGLVETFGRIDDLYSLVGTDLEKDAMRVLYALTMIDLSKTDGTSLVGKWLKTVNTKNDRTRRLGLLTAKYFYAFKNGQDDIKDKYDAQELASLSKQYRKICVSLRKKLDIVERHVCSNKYGKIDYEKVPSLANLKYKKLFYKKDEQRFKEFLEGVKKGEKKINAETLTPTDIMLKGALKCSLEGYELSKYDESLEQLWNNLPNFVKGANDIIVVADTSGSMTCCEKRPLATSIGLSLYLAERNEGVWKNKFITFSRKPSFVELKGYTLNEKLKRVPSMVENTNLEKVFKLILKTAVDNSLTQEQLVKNILIISDMEFDEGSYKSSVCYTKAMKALFEEKGYILPRVIYWNVASNRTVFHASAKDENVTLVSGYSPSIINCVLKGKTPYDVMLEALNDEVFDIIDELMN